MRDRRLAHESGGRMQLFGITLAVAMLLGSLSLHATHAAAQTQKYPTKPVRLLVPFAPGGGTDIVARVIAQKMTETLKQSVIVDNRPGAGGTVGAETAVR